MNEPYSDAPRYAALAAKIIAGRTAFGLTQAAFAAELGFRQQAVSRWEAGTHRPAVDQIPVLAALLKDDVASIMRLAEYGSAVTTSLSAQFPVDALDPATFEHFVADVVQALHPSAEVRLQGGRGHKQHGSDIILRFRDGRTWSFQCKRVERFGKGDVTKAIACYRVNHERAFLVISKIASPTVAEVLEGHPGWTLWDKQDLTRKIRSLPTEAQERLVDLYFRGQRMALLGRSEPGPWLTLEDYFAPFMKRNSALTHTWPLVGREAEIDLLVAAIQRKDVGFVILSGPGGIGKTRLLMEAIERLPHSEAAAVRFLSASQEPDAASLEALGTGAKTLVVDDAHDREGLKLLIEYTSNPRHRTRLLIATRPYAEQRIRNELAIYGIVDPFSIDLNRLSRNALRDLVVQVLHDQGGSSEWADSILGIASDSPLVAIMATRVVIRDGIIPELARGEQDLRRIIISRFADVVAGHIGLTSDATLVRAVLEVLSLIQPFRIEDDSIASLVSTTKPEISSTDVSRALRMLNDGGVIYRRGSLYRLMPDLLGDFLIEESCIGIDGRLTEFALTVANSVSGSQLAQVLVNLGRTNWRLEEGDPSESNLLEPIWQNLRSISDHYDNRIAAVQAVAYYQPRQALSFIEHQIAQGRILSEFGTILNRIAFSPLYRTDALRLLWELGQKDERDLNPHPSHPIRILQNLVSYDCDKPLPLIEEIATFGFALIDEETAWTSKYTPLDLLTPLLKGEGMRTKASARNISMSPFFVDYDSIVHLRQKLVRHAMTLLHSNNLHIAYQASTFLGEALRPPTGILNSIVPVELLQLYEAEFGRTIDEIATLVTTGALAPTTLLGLIKTLAWHAEFDQGQNGEKARRIYFALPDDLSFRFYAALVEGAQYQFVGQVRYAEWEDDQDWLAGLVDELLTTYPDRRALCRAFLAYRATVEVAGISTLASHPLMFRLIQADLALAREIVERSQYEATTALRDYLGYSVGALLDLQPEEGRARIAQFLASPDPALRQQTARGLLGLRREHDTADIDLLRQALGAADPAVASAAVTALRTWGQIDDRQAITLLLEVNFELETDLFEAVCMHICNRHSTALDHLRAGDVISLLNRARSLPSLEGYWAGEFLSRLIARFGTLLAQFVLDRIDLEVSGKTARSYRAIGRPHRRSHLNLQQSSESAEILERVWIWIRQHDAGSGWLCYQIGEAFSSLFKIESTQVVEYFDAMLDRATVGDLRWIGHILRHSHHRFIFQQSSFVDRYLNRCKEVGSDLVRDVTNQLRAAAISGIWSGTVGEPAPRDIQTREEATPFLSSLPRLSPAYPLYRSVLDHANRNISESIAEANAMDDDE
jgi:transcriptional regulator with XRE-family HTH domain